jgi:hypothetical protein
MVDRGWDAGFLGFWRRLSRVNFVCNVAKDVVVVKWRQGIYVGAIMIKRCRESVHLTHIISTTSRLLSNNAPLFLPSTSAPPTAPS